MTMIVAVVAGKTTDLTVVTSAALAASPLRSPALRRAGAAHLHHCWVPSLNVGWMWVALALAGSAVDDAEALQDEEDECRRQVRALVARDDAEYVSAMRALHPSYAVVPPLLGGSLRKREVLGLPEDDSAACLLLREATRRAARRRDLASRPPPDPSRCPDPMDYRTFTRMGIEKTVAPSSFLLAGSGSPLGLGELCGEVSAGVVREQALQALRCCDPHGSGRLSEQGVLSFVTEMLPTLPGVGELPEHYHPYWICHAVRRLMFSLDPYRRGYVSIRKLVSSASLAELLRLRFEVDDGGNWFGVARLNETYETFTQLDVDQDGLLGEDELMAFDCYAPSSTFVSGVFNAHKTHRGKLDFRFFLDFLLTAEFPLEKAAVLYSWRALDPCGAGRVDIAVVWHCCSELAMRLEELDAAVPCENLMSEIMDMFMCRDPGVLTFDDVRRSPYGSLALAILVNFNTWRRYDQRDAAAAAAAAAARAERESDRDGEIGPS